MFIKSIRVKGLLSYREEAEVELSRGMNVFVGPNGSGKSSFITAIQLAVTDEYRRLSSVKRQEIHYNGRVHGVRTPAYVEVVFDNEDRRLPVDSDTVTLRRDFGLKKDRLYINGKEVTDIKVYLQSAGFTNPYFMVKQGQIVNIAMATNEQRLQHLKDIAGTAQIESNMRQAAAKEEEARIVREDIDAKIAALNDRIDVLEREKNLMENAATLDTDKRSIEYLLQEEEVKKLNSKVTELDAKLRIWREEIQREKATKKEKATAEQKRLDETEKELKKKESLLKAVRSKITVWDKQLEALAQQLHGEERKVEECKKEIELRTLEDSRNAEILQDIKKQLEESTVQLTTLEKKYEEYHEQETEARKKFTVADKTLKQMSQQFQRYSEFGTAKERNDWIETRIQQRRQDLEKQQGAIKETEKRISTAEQARKEKEEKVLDLQGQLQRIEGEMKTIEERRTNVEDQLQRKKMEITQTRGELFDKQESLQAKTDCQWKSRNLLIRRAGKSAIVGMEGVREVVTALVATDEKQHPEQIGYYGVLLDCFQNTENVHLAIEAAAGKKLFYHVVRDVQLGLRIMREFNRQQLPGEVHFMPLDRINQKVTNFQDSSVASSLLKHIHVLDDRTLPAIEQVFGRTLLCQSLEVATRLAKANGLTCVTTEGDKVESAGVISGGYVDSTCSKILMYTDWYRSGMEVFGIKEKISTLEASEATLQQEVQQLTAKCENFRSQLERHTNNVEQTLASIRAARAAAEEKQLFITKEKQLKEKLEEALREIKVEIDMLEKERGEELRSPRDRELRKIEQLRAEVKRESRLVKELSGLRAETEKELVKLRAKINLELKPKEEQLSVSGLQGVDALTNDRNRLEASCKELTAHIDHGTKKRMDCQFGEEKLCKEIRALTEIWNNSQEELKELLQGLSSEDPAFRENLARLTQLQDQLKGMKHDGVMPAGVSKYQGKSRKFLQEKLKQINAEMKDLHVDIAQVNVYSRLGDIKTEVQERMEELDAAQRSLESLKDELERQKRNRLIQFFVNVQRHFKKIFQEFVPNGQANLVLYGNEIEIANLDEGQPLPEVEEHELKGVGIRVSFLSNSGNCPSQLIQQLSGGQKSLLAVTLILAIQKVHPVPIYLLDEVDQALDPSYRNAVAKYIKSVAEEAQFICTTFRREFVEQADQHFGVLFTNMVSTVKPVAMEEALAFVEDSFVTSSGTESGNEDISSRLGNPDSSLEIPARASFPTPQA